MTRDPPVATLLLKPAVEAGPEVVLEDRLPTWRRLRRWLWYRVTRGVLAVVERSPATAGRALCRGLARLGLWLRPRERDRARRNLRLVYPDADPAWRACLLRDSADSLGEVLHATLSLRREASRGFPGVVEAPGPDGRGAVAVLGELLAEDRGALVVTGHLGCWELLAAWLARRLPLTAVITGTVRNPAVDRLLQDRRRALGLEPLPRDRGARPLLRALDRGAAVGVLIDQNTRAASAMVPFLGRPAPTPLGPARVARRRRTPILPAAMVREEGRWVLQHLAPIDPSTARDERELTARCNEALETMIRRNPEQWVWFHDRWGVAKGS